MHFSKFNLDFLPAPRQTNVIPVEVAAGLSRAAGVNALFRFIGLCSAAYITSETGGIRSGAIALSRIWHSPEKQELEMYGSFFARSLLALSLMAGSALAQTAAPAPAPAAAPAPLSASHLAIAMELVRLSGMSRSIDLIVPETVVRARFALTQLHPKLQDDINKVADALTPEFVALANEAFQVAGNAFGQKMTEADLIELKKFFTSDVGKRFVAAQPAIIEDMYKQLDQFTAKVSQVVIDKMRDELKKRGHAL